MALLAELYRPEAAKDWDELVRRSRNGTFLFLRDYMDYHADRFKDSSIVVRNARGAVVGVLAASVKGSVVTSHGGLTYGGLVVADAPSKLVCEALDAAAATLRATGASELVYKTVPWIYQVAPAEEDRHWLFLQDAELIRRDVLSVIDREHRLGLQERRERSVRRAVDANLTIRRTSNFSSFWQLLTDNLRERYSLEPVHSLEEITLLAGRFPDSIQLYEAVIDDEVVAGAVVYLTKRVCHVQYNAASPIGRQFGALDLVLTDLMRRFGSWRFFDFGVSTEENGRFVNRGLMEYKEGFGARTVVHDFYRLNLVA